MAGSAAVAPVVEVSLTDPGTVGVGVRGAGAATTFQAGSLVAVRPASCHQPTPRASRSTNPPTSNAGRALRAARWDAGVVAVPSRAVGCPVAAGVGAESGAAYGSTTRRTVGQALEPTPPTAAPRTAHGASASGSAKVAESAGPDSRATLGSRNRGPASLATVARSTSGNCSPVMNGTASTHGVAPADDPDVGPPPTGSESPEVGRRFK